MMNAMVLEHQGAPLVLRELATPTPGAGEILIRVAVCGVCRTDLHIVDGDLTGAALPLVPGHEIIGSVEALGPGVADIRIGERVGVPWLGYTCGTCRDCLSGRENLCTNAGFTGYTRPGGYAEYTIADHRYCFPVPDHFNDQAAAPLMCAGLIGYRAYNMCPDKTRLGLYGFGAAAHIIAQIAVHDGHEVYAFTRSGDTRGQRFAQALGARWAGSSDERPPAELDAAIIFAPVGALVPAALKAVRKAGTVICAGIHMSDIPSFPYRDLWEERSIRSVANLTRQDGERFLPAAAAARVTTATHAYALSDANQALADLRAGRFEGAAVLVAG